MGELVAVLVGALPGIAALAAGTVRWRAWRSAGRLPLPARLALLLLLALAVGACHSTHRDAFAEGPVPIEKVPFNEPVVLSLKNELGSAGDPVPTMNGLLGSYFAGAGYERLDFQRIDPQVDFFWDAIAAPPVTSPDAFDTDDGCGSFCGLPRRWGIWSVAWEGYLEAPVAGTYVLGVHVNNGGWLQMKGPDGALEIVVNAAGGPSFEGTVTATRELTAGRHYIRFSFFQNGPPTGVARLLWQPPGATQIHVIPTSALWTQVSSLPPLIFIPGLAGSSLRAAQEHTVTVPTSRGVDRQISYSEGDVLWVEPVRALFDAEFYEVLMFTDGGESLAPSLEADGVLPTYGDVTTFFTSAGYRDGETLWTFPYDWRYGVERNVAALDALAERILASTGSRQVDIVAHSLGTLVVRAYLRTEAAHEKVRQAILLGGPLLGTPRGTFAVIEGLCATQIALLCVVPPQHTRHVLRTLPGALQTAVSPKYFDVFDGSDREHPLALVDHRLFGGPVASFGYAYLREQELTSGVSGAALLQAESFHADDLTWLSPTIRPLPNVSLVAGTGRCTIGQITKRTSIFRSGNRVSFRDTHDIREIDGDDTVVRQSAALTDPTAGFSANFGAPVYYRHLSHGELAAAPGLSTALDLLQGNPVPVGSPSAPFCLSFIVGSPMEFVITDASGGQIGGLDPARISREIPGATYDRVAETKFATVDLASRYKVDLVGTAVGDSTIRVRWVSAGDVEQEGIFLHVPTTPRTRATVAFAADRSLTSLELDHDGDGTIDELLSPVILTGLAAQDDTAPHVEVVSPISGQAVVGTFDLGWSAVDPESGLASAIALIDRGSPTEQMHASPGSLELVPGAHVLEVFAENRLGLVQVATRATTAYDYDWLVPLGANGTFTERAGRTIPVRFTVTDLSGEFVVDESVTARLVDSAGHTVVEEVGIGRDPNSAIVVQRGFYQTNMPTQGLRSGGYRIEVHFDSLSLTGRLSLPVELR